jgi:hypothetical protein
MACFSPDLEAAIINNLLRGQSMDFGGGASGPATASVYVGLFTALPVGGIGGTEVTGGDYARVAVASTLGNWAAPSNGETANAAPIKFAIPSADWGEVLGVGVWSAASAGTLLLHGTISPTRTIISGQAAPVFVPGALILRLDQS